MNKVSIIAEIGVNHNGSEDLAKKLVDSAKNAGADIVKFQTFIASNLVTQDAKKAKYQERISASGDSQFSMLNALELSFNSFKNIARYCENVGIKFMSTAFDKECLDFLVDEIQVNVLKIPSGEITNAPLILEHAKKGLDIFLSTGMASMEEIEDALGVIAYGYMNQGKSNKNLSKENFSNAIKSKAGKRLIKEKVTIFHCTTEYPAPVDEINLNALTQISNTFNTKIGYSDHSKGILIPVSAVAMGALVIEKHFTLDNSMDGPDHFASLEPEEFKEMVDGIRDCEKYMGDGIKKATKSEVQNKLASRKSLVAGRDITSGELFTKDNIDIKRPGGGISPMFFWKILGTNSDRDYSKDELIIYDE